MSYNSEVLTDSPAFYWRLDDTNTTCVDTGPNTKNGTYNGGYTQNQNSLEYQGTNKSTLFNGSTGYVGLGTNQLQPILSGASGITVECLFKLTSFPGAMSLVSLFGDLNTWPLLSFYLAGGTDLRLRFYDPVAGYTFTACDYTGSISNGITYHAAAVIDLAPSPNTLSLYLDGRLVKSVTDSRATSSVVVGTPTLIDRLGSDVATSGQFLNGTLDEVAIYTTALSEARIYAHSSAARCRYLTFNKPTHRALRSVQRPLHHIGI